MTEWSSRKEATISPISVKISFTREFNLVGCDSCSCSSLCRLISRYFGQDFAWSYRAFQWPSLSIISSNHRQWCSNSGSGPFRSQLSAKLAGKQSKQWPRKQFKKQTATAYSGRSVWPFWRGRVRCRCWPCRSTGRRPPSERGWSAAIRWAVADAWCRPTRECERIVRFAGQRWSRCWRSGCHYLEERE